MAGTAHSHRRKAPESRADAKAETREALIDAAAALFGKHGFDAPSLDDICARAGYTRGAFYVHFKSREELIVAVVERHSRRALDAIVGAGDEVDLAAVVRRFTDAVATGRYPRGGAVKLHHFLDACARSRLLRERQSAHLDRTRARLAAATRAAQSARAVRPDLPADDVALILMTIVMGVEQLLELGYPFDIRAGAAALLRLLRP
ncbi:MAG TPA: helix-turn-helix domain-containing protein [Polyangia bacterium]|nr:helix-turn-helix domain-containing protein [Polyangia bacterium]